MTLWGQTCIAIAMPFTFDSRRKKPTTLDALFPGATFVDVTSRGEQPWQQLSPFYPHGQIPVPFSPGVVAQSVEGIWQGLKVFEHAGVDPTKFEVTSMKDIKRSVRKNGSVRGHQRGLSTDTLLSYLDARYEIYLPSYAFVLAGPASDVVDKLREMGAKSQVVLLDYETNGDVECLRRPLSHASLVCSWLNGAWQPVD